MHFSSKPNNSGHLDSYHFFIQVLNNNTLSVTEKLDVIYIYYKESIKSDNQEVPKDFLDLLSVPTYLLEDRIFEELENNLVLEIGSE